MKYLDYTTVLPERAPSPDLSNQPNLTDFVPPDLWNRRIEIHMLQAQGNQEHPDVQRFQEASQRWLTAVQLYTKKLESEHKIEFCNWNVYSTQHEKHSILWIQHALHGPWESKHYNLETVIGILRTKQGTEGIPGWDTSSPLHQQALIKALWQYIFINRLIPG